MCIRDSKKMIAPVMARANWVVENPAETTLELDYGKLETLDRWSWCDALFMAPRVYAKLYALTTDISSSQRPACAICVAGTAFMTMFPTAEPAKIWDCFPPIIVSPETIP